MSTKFYSVFANVLLVTLFLALVSPAFSIGQGENCASNRNGCAHGLTCLHGRSNVPFQCHSLKGEGMACNFEPFWVCRSHLRCAHSPDSPRGTCVPPNLPTPKGGFCGFDRSNRKCPPGYRCVIKYQIGHCEDVTPPSRTPKPSPSRTPKPSPSRTPKPSPSHTPDPVYSDPPLLSDDRKKRIRQKIKAAGGCNANVCFAIDGSGSISPEEFNAEKLFVLNVVSLLTDNPVELAAVQFSTSTNPIQSLTADDEQFIRRVQDTNQIPGSSFVTGGVNYCLSELFHRPGESNKIVLLSDGQRNIGGSAARAADAFRSLGGSVCVVGAGDQNEQELLGITGGDRSLYFRLDNFLDYVTLADHIESVTLRACSVPE